MAVRDGVIKGLLEREGRIVSGESLSSSLGCSRMAVSKSVAELRRAGYSIESVRGAGYRLTLSGELTPEVVSRDFHIRSFLVDSSESTQTDARNILSSGVKPPFAVMAEKQISGRGRLGRPFYSPEGGVYFSLVIPGFLIPKPSLLTLAASLAVSRSVEEVTHRKTGIKWVNDVFVDGLKVSGILTEGVIGMEDGALSHAIVGIGINLSGDDSTIPDELRGIMGFLYPAGKSPVSRSSLASSVTDNLIELLDKDFIDEYREKCFVIGRRVNVVGLSDSRPATALSVNDDGHLIVRYDDGTIDEIFSGEVTLKL